MKILIIVLTCLDNGIYSKFYNVQNETWNSKDEEDTSTFFYINGGVKKEINGHFVVNNLPETVSNGGYKLVNCLLKTFDLEYDYIYHTNSSSYLDKKLLKKWLVDKPRKNFYSGVVGNHNGIKFASGCGFTMSKDVVNLILENEHNWIHGSNDDVTLGKLLSDLNIDVYPAPRFDVNKNNVDKIPDNYFHYRCNTNDRNFDADNLKKIHEIKKNNIF